MERQASVRDASKALKDMKGDINNAKEKTLAYWRVKSDGKIIEALEDFCRGDEKKLKDEEETINHYTKKTTNLFYKLNIIMAEQERGVSFLPQQEFIDMRAPDREFCTFHHCSLTRSIRSSISDRDFRNLSSNGSSSMNLSTLDLDREVVAIVFGGKEVDPPLSLSENLVKTLSESCEHVYSASRSAVKSKNKKITHFQEKDLCDKPQKGVQGFVNVIETCIKEYFPPQLKNTKHKERVLVMYFTLGFHKGQDIFNANLRCAKNFAQALSMTLSLRSDIKWKVIVTGTDATQLSNKKNITVEWERESASSSGENIVNSEKLTIPSYKIGKWNYVYAMSKLGQFYIIADAVATFPIGKGICKKELEDKNVNLSEVVKKITRHVELAGDKSMYDETIENIISMEELDKISSDWTNLVQPLLATHLQVAIGLSILYTPLHCRNWVTQAVKSSNEDKEKYGGSVRAHIVFEIVKRLSNAISTDMGTRCHTFHGYVEQDYGNEETAKVTKESIRE